MAHKIKAVNAYRPRIEQGNTVQKAEFVRAVSRATSLVEGTVDLSIKESRDQIIEFCRAGRAVKLEGLGIFTPSIDLEGNIAISFRADPALNYGLNVPGTFSGTILNRERERTASARRAMNSSLNGTNKTPTIKSRLLPDPCVQSRTPRIHSGRY